MCRSFSTRMDPVCLSVCVWFDVWNVHYAAYSKKGFRFFKYLARYTSPANGAYIFENAFFPENHNSKCRHSIPNSRRKPATAKR